MKKMNLLRRMQVLQSSMLVLVMAMMLALVHVSGLIPGLSQKADGEKEKAKMETYEKEYKRGTIYDRNGNALAWSHGVGTKRNYAHPYAYSSLLGYYSKIYGSYGLEKTFGDQLLHSESKEEDKRGADISLTIDGNLQEQAYNLIKDMAASIVIMDAKSGELLTLTSSPSFNANALEEEWEEINKKEGIFYSNAFQNAVTPGSVFKLITSKEILEAGIDQEIVYDEGSLRVNGQTIHNYDGNSYGPLTYIDGLTRSSNVYFMDRALKLGCQKMDQTAKAFSLGEDIPLDFTTLHSNYSLKDYSDNVLAVTAFGQGETLVTPLQMAMVADSICQDGIMMKPHLIKSIVDAKGNMIQEGKSEVYSKVMEPEVAWKIRSGMEACSEAYEMCPIGYNEWGGRIAAKTGTAQRGDGTNNAWLVTYAPADNPQYVIVACRLKTTEIGKSLVPEVEELYNILFKKEAEQL